MARVKRLSAKALESPGWTRCRERRARSSGELADEPCRSGRGNGDVSVTDSRRDRRRHRLLAPPSRQYRGTRLVWGLTFPWGTMAINIAGSFAMGVFYRDAGAALQRCIEGNCACSWRPASSAASPLFPPSRSISRCCGRGRGQAGGGYGLAAVVAPAGAVCGSCRDLG